MDDRATRRNDVSESDGKQAIKPPLKVFLVEDSTLIRERLAEALSSSGRVEIVGHADDQSSAIAALREAPCDAVVLDLDLKQGNGLEVLKSLRAGKGVRTPPVVIVFTNYVDPHYRAQSMRLGANFFFDKARDFDRVREIIEKLAVPGGIVPA